MRELVKPFGLFLLWLLAVPSALAADESQSPMQITAHGIKHVFMHKAVTGAGDRQGAMSAVSFMYSRCWSAQFAAIGGTPFTPTEDHYVSAVVDDGQGFDVVTGPRGEGNSYRLEKTDWKADYCGFRIVSARMAQTGAVLPVIDPSGKIIGAQQQDTAAQQQDTAAQQQERGRIAKIIAAQQPDTAVQQPDTAVQQPDTAVQQQELDPVLERQKRERIDKEIREQLARKYIEDQKRAGQYANERKRRRATGEWLFWPGVLFGLGALIAPWVMLQNKRSRWEAFVTAVVLTGGLIILTGLHGNLGDAGHELLLSILLILSCIVMSVGLFIFAIMGSAKGKVMSDE